MVMRVSQGLRVTPVSGLSLVAFQPYSGMAVLPSTMAPCSRSLATAGASMVCGSVLVSREPKRAGMPATRHVVLDADRHAVDEPLAGSPACQRASAARAAASAPSGSRWH